MSTIITMAETCTRLLMLCQDHPALKSAHTKVENLLVTTIKAQTSFSQDQVRAIVNTGSLKAVKALPKEAQLGRDAYNSYVLNASFILRQPKAFLLAAKARGMTINEPAYRKIFDNLASAKADHATDVEQARLLFSIFEPDSTLLCHLTHKALTSDAPTSAALGPMLATALTSIAKRDKDAIQRDFTNACSIYDPSAAHALLYRKMAIYALLGVTMPSKDTFIHPDMVTLAQTMTGRAGKQTIETLTGGLEAFLSGGHLRPTGIIKAYEDKRRSWRG